MAASARPARIGDTIRVGRIYGTVDRIDLDGTAHVQGAHWEWTGPVTNLIPEGV